MLATTQRNNMRRQWKPWRVNYWVAFRSDLAHTVTVQATGREHALIIAALQTRNEPFHVHVKRATASPVEVEE